MEGSRTNQNIPKDRFQDFDVTYFVDDPALYTEDDTWVNVFGERLIMQKPEDMELFPAVEDGYSFLMFFTDYNKIDLTILPLTALEDYLNGDGLREILLDKDGRVEEKPTPTDKEYHIQKPAPAALTTAATSSGISRYMSSRASAAASCYLPSTCLR